MGVILNSDFMNSFLWSNSHEPQRTSNGHLMIPGVGDETAGDGKILMLSAKNYPLPSDMNTPVEISWNNERKKFAGAEMVEDIDIEVEQAVSPNVAKAIAEWRESVYDPKTGQVGWATDYKRRGYMFLYPPDGKEHTNVTSSFTAYVLYGCWPSSFRRGNIDHAGADVVRMTLTLTVDKIFEFFSGTFEDLENKAAGQAEDFFDSAGPA